MAGVLAAEEIESVPLIRIWQGGQALRAFYSLKEVVSSSAIIVSRAEDNTS
jgi:hypothetical protein